MRVAVPALVGRRVEGRGLAHLAAEITDGVEAVALHPLLEPALDLAERDDERTFPRYRSAEDDPDPDGPAPEVEVAGASIIP